MKLLYITILFFFLSLFKSEEPTKVIVDNIDSISKTIDTVVGIDISVHQGKINWYKLPETHFVFIKATEGISIKDRMFRHNWDSAKKYGIKRGAYHFYRPYVTPYEQFKNFKSVVKLESGDLPPVLDAEIYSKYPERLKRDLKIFSSLVERHYGVKPIIYCNSSFYKRYFNNVYYQNHHFWIANYVSKSLDSIVPTWDIWQYTCYGKVSGINAYVDKNYFRWGYDSLHKICLN